MTRSRLGRLVFVALLVMGLTLVIKGAWIPLKAELAQLLLQRAWAQTQQDGQPHKPWLWADHWPVARLRVPAHGIDQIVLAGDGGNVLAFAPGQNVRASRPGEPGTSIISGHRDTHFRFLKHIQVGERIEVETPSERLTYQVLNTRVVDSRRSGIQIRVGVDELLLVTCYPFDSLVAGGPLRFVTETRKISPSGPGGIAVL